jgi:6-phosphogluconolactonase
MEIDSFPERVARPRGRWSRLTWDRGRRHPRVATIVATLGTFATVVAPASAGSTAFAATSVGAVYVASNSYAGNEILTFPRYADGSLGPVEAATATGGKGSGAGSGSGALAAIQNDPLGSQGSLLVDPTGRFLYAVNAGSNDVSVFTVSPHGLTLVDREPSGGAYPVSLTAFGNTLYVLNAVGNSVTDFTVTGGGQLIRPTTCGLPALPAGMDPLLPATAASSAQPVGTETAGQIGFGPDGTLLLVASKEGPLALGFPFGNTLGAGRIYAYQVNSFSRALRNCGNPHTFTFPLNGPGLGKFPFSFTWTAQGDLILNEVFGISSSPSNLPGGVSALGTFAVSADGTLTPIATVADPSPVPCWIVRSGNNVYVANYLGSDITGYQVTADGRLNLMPIPVTSLGAGTQPIDMAISTGGQFIYQLDPGTAQVFPFRVGVAGNLTPLPSMSLGLPPNSGDAGIATVTFS